MIRIPRNPLTEVALQGLEGFKDAFIASRIVELVILRRALAFQDYSAMMQITHRWKGFSAPYGFGELGYLSNELERSAKNKQLILCHELIEEIAAYLASK